MNLSSSSPDVVQKSLGIPGSASPVMKMVVGSLVTFILLWAGLKALRQVMKDRKTP
jgi:hypothetical protein